MSGKMIISDEAHKKKTKTATVKKVRRIAHRMHVANVHYVDE